MIGWEPGPTAGGMAGIIANPTRVPGVARWQLIQRMPTYPLRGIDFSPRGQLTVGSGDCLVRVYETADMRLVHLIGPHVRPTSYDSSVAVRFSPDGAWLATAADDGVRFVNIDTSRSVFVELTIEPWELDWHPRGRMVAVAGVPHGVVYVAALMADDAATVPAGASDSSF